MTQRINKQNPKPLIRLELIPEERYIFIFDRSERKDTVHFDALKNAAHFWIDYVNPKESLGIISYANSAKFASRLSRFSTQPEEANAWRSVNHKAIEKIKTDEKDTSLEKALEKGYKNIIDNGLAARQTIILITNKDIDIEVKAVKNLIANIISAGVRIFPISIGKQQHPEILKQIALSTHGKYLGINQHLKTKQSSFFIPSILAYAAGVARANSAVVSFEEIDGSTVKEKYKPSKRSIPFMSLQKSNEQQKPNKRKIDFFEFPVHITKGSSQCTIGALWQNSKHQFTIQVRDPKGKIIRRSKYKRKVEGAFPYSYFVINRPKAGEWTVRISGANIRDEKFRSIGFEVNRKTRMETIVLNPIVSPGDSIKLKVRLKYKYPIPGVNLTILVRTPSGKWTDYKISTKKQDGKYTNVLEIPTTKNKSGEYLIYIKAHKKAERVTIPIDEKMQIKNTILPKRRKFNDIELNVPEIYREQLIVVTKGKKSESKSQLITGYNLKNIYAPKNQADFLKQWEKINPK